MRDFTHTDAAGKNKRDSRPSMIPTNAAPDQATFSGQDGSAEDDVTAALKSSIAGNLAPQGITSITFADPPELTNARALIQGREDEYVHTTDGTPNGTLCDWTVPFNASIKTKSCPVCELLDC